MKRKLLILLVLTFLVSAIPVLVHAENNTSWNFDNGILTISGNGDMTDYNSTDKRPWENILTQINKIIIKEGITSVGDWSFAYCTNVSELSLPQSLKDIGIRSFYNCNMLTHIKTPYNVVSIGDGAFNSCTNVTRVDLPDKLEKIGASAFMNLPHLSALIIPKNVNNIGQWAFFGNTSMKGLYFEGDIPQHIGLYIIANIHKDYSVYYDKSYQNNWFDANMFDEKHVLIYDSNEFIPVYLNNSMLNFDSQPIITNDRTLVPMRKIFEAMGAVVDWDDTTRTAIAKKGDITISIHINSKIMYKNNTAINLDTPAMIVDDRTLVPVRAISEALGAEVTWNKYERSVNIKY